MIRVVVSPSLCEASLDHLASACPTASFIPMEEAATRSWKQETVLVAAHLDAIGQDAALIAFLSAVSQQEEAFEGAVCGAFMESETPLFTRDAGVRLLYLLNRMGARLPGRSLVEATPRLDNLTPLSGPLGKSREELLRSSLRSLADHLTAAPASLSHPRLSVWTIGRKDVSATRAVWEMLEPKLDGIDIDFLPFGGELIHDCRGCAYELCKKMGQQSKCIYEDYVVESLYPSIERSDAILILSPNYNDMLPANFISSINRMTALFRKRKFFDKQLFAITVSGHTGGERLSQQLIGALHVNKTFALPPHFSLEIRAHNVEAVRSDATIPPRLEAFGENIRKQLLG